MAKFIESSKIKVFPAGFRNDALDTSKLTTEENLTSLTILSSDKGIGNRWIINPLNDAETIIYIKGYRFVFATADIPENCTWAAIQLRELGVGNNKTNVLKPVDAVDPNASALDDDNGNFLGLGFYENEPGVTSDCKVQKDSSLVLNSLEIKNNTLDTNIAEQFNTKKIIVGNITINEGNSADIKGVNTVNGLSLGGDPEGISIISSSGTTSSLTVADGVNVNITSNETTLGDIILAKEGTDVKINDFNLPNNTSANMLLASDGTTNSWIEYSVSAKANTIVKRIGNDIKTHTLNNIKIWLDKTTPTEPILKVVHEDDASLRSGLGIEWPATLTVASDGSIQTDTNNDGTNVISVGAGTLIKQDENKKFVQIGNTTGGIEKVITLPLEGISGGVLYDKGNNTAEWRHTTTNGHPLASANENARKIVMTDGNGYIEGLAPTNHATSETTYGLATDGYYGHVQLGVGDVSDAAYENGIAASIAHNHDTKYAKKLEKDITAKSVGENTAKKLSYGESFKIPKFSVNENGLINSTPEDIALTLPNAYNKVSVEKVTDYPEAHGDDRIIYLTGVSKNEFDENLGEKSAVDTTLQLYYNKENQVPVYIKNGNLYTPQLYLTSDKRLKENERLYKFDKSILDLPIYKYDYINGSKNQIGCMAQDLKKICPEIVEEDEEGYLHIQESKIVYLLIEEIKKLKEEIKNLKKYNYVLF